MPAVQLHDQPRWKFLAFPPGADDHLVHILHAARQHRRDPLHDVLDLGENLTQIRRVRVIRVDLNSYRRLLFGLCGRESIRDILRQLLGTGEVRGLRRALGCGRNQCVVVERLNDLVYRLLTARKRRLRQIRFGTFGRRTADRDGRC